MVDEVNVTLQAIPFMKKSDDLEHHCLNKARSMTRLVQTNPYAFVPLSDRFYLMSKGYIPFVSRPKWTCRENLPVTLVATTAAEDQMAHLNARFQAPKQADAPLTNWNKLGG
ncbi:hypothetical protein Y032_0455g1766 [Ancylostoma ceylanicum]|uniref:Uncharacterized protein n=1 Tax=Ancylostoma ceylanicum TaxID=53326 RepID=A0A016WXV3_9BILA|nr:hypothetical protein Y032_0455g1766 [Ancylostoma ceylanicum]